MPGKPKFRLLALSVPGLLDALELSAVVSHNRTMCIRLEVFFLLYINFDSWFKHDDFRMEMSLLR